jgi:peptidyl-tRNA hydrolase, PTH1 family
MGTDYLLAGLGNPGAEYAQSPHNAGFEVADRVRAACGGPRFSLRGPAALSLCRWRGSSVLVLKPLTYMNLSGVEVARHVRRESLPPDRLIVCYDDLDLPLGQVRLRASGGAGGHHGMESILQHLGSGDFPRVRIGIQDPGVSKSGHVDYLLNPVSAESRPVLEEAYGCAAKAILDAVHFGFVKAMNLHNRRRGPSEGQPPEDG